MSEHNDSEWNIAMSDSERSDTLFPLQPLLPKTRGMIKTGSCSDVSSRKLLAIRPSGVRGGGSDLIPPSPSDIEQLQQQKANSRHGHWIIWPWNRYYRIWWHLTALGAMLTVFLAPYQIAFEEQAPPATLRDIGSDLEEVLTFLFTIDIIINFNLARYKNDAIVLERRQIATEYIRGMFCFDLMGVFPFQRVALYFARNDIDSLTFLMLSLSRLFRYARLHHVRRLSHELQNNARVSLLSFTLFRNFAVVVIACHFQACCMYFLARLHDFDNDTWLGPIVYDSETTFGRYITSLYWSITTFCTVGYGDFSPVNPEEKIAGSFFMLLNIAVAAWIIGSITLLMLKGDEQTREYRDSLETLHQYGSMHDFDQPLLDKLKEQLRLEFNNREIADEQVLRHFPSAVRRKILRRLYKDHLINTKIMSGVRPQFLDAFLISCTVEIFSPGEEIVERGSILSDLFLLVGGIAEVETTMNLGSYSKDVENGEYSTNQTSPHSPIILAGEFIGEIGFFCESPQVESVISLTVCKTLTMSRSTYKLLSQDHPGSIGLILQNLLSKVESESMQRQLPKPVEVLRVGSKYDMVEGYQSIDRTDLSPETESIFRQRYESLTAVKDLVTMHMRRTLDDETTRLLFASSRGDTHTISLMCDQGFDPNNRDYDNRTALMVASSKGSTEAVNLLLQYKACPNKFDMHGSSALLDATKGGHEEIMDLLFQYGATLCMPESQAASILCQAVFDGDILLLKRLLKAGIDINAADYDKRTAAHIAAAEGNVAAIRVLAEQGANLSLPDRWGQTVEDEARRSNARQLMVFLEGRK
ncbi:hypothetical protein ACHAXR_010362 [Thalassiosira sp. AJA248-18]